MPMASRTFSPAQGHVSTNADVGPGSYSPKLPGAQMYRPRSAGPCGSFQLSVGRVERPQTTPGPDEYSPGKRVAAAEWERVRFQADLARRSGAGFGSRVPRGLGK